MQDYRNLNVWCRAHQFILRVYQLTKRFPSDERFGLVSQLRRSAASVAANLAEGCGRGSDANFARFAQMAMGSASETEYHLLLAHDLVCFENTPYTQTDEEIRRIKRMINALITTLRK